MARSLAPAMAAPAQVLEGKRQELELVAEPIAVRQARSWLSSVVGGFVPAMRLHELQLVFAEVVTNAVRHGAPGEIVRIATTPKPDYLCVQVTDEGAGLVPRPGAMASDEYGGFGLSIVKRLPRRWGVTREKGHTRVWFEFDYE